MFGPALAATVGYTGADSSLRLNSSMPQSTKYTTGQLPLCPHCGEDLQEGPIEDYVVRPLGSALARTTEADCGHCDRLFDVSQLDADTYVVTPKPGSR